MKRPSCTGLRCKYCGSDTHEDVTKVAIWKGKSLVVVKDIPVRLCDGCEEQFFEQEITQRIEKVVTNPAEKAKRQIRVPIYSMSQVQAVKKQVIEPDEADQEDGEALLCKYCRSETVADLVKSAFWVSNRLIAVEDIPARVCRQCNEQFYDEQTTEKITALEKQASALGMTKRYELVSVFSLADSDDVAP